MEQLTGILFIDIETVPLFPHYDMLPEGMQKAWVHKSKLLKAAPDVTSDPASLFSERAGIFSEFAKVVCIGLGTLHQHEGSWKMRLKSITNDDEKQLLIDFCNTVTKFTDRYKEIRFCGHNIKEFDIPFLCRRLIINRMELPTCMQLSGKKPWEITHIDTMDMWRFGDYKNYTPLALLAEVLGIPSPKSDIDGSMVAHVYWEEKDLARIGKYCMQDVLTSAKVLLKLRGLHDIVPEPAFATE
jgi:hypothetical protein